MYACRILPVGYTIWMQEDVSLFEKETGAALRALDFVFKTSAGVNRPLQPNEDRPNDNLNKTVYRDQTNKVANAIKEIITALKNPVSLSGESTAAEKPASSPTQPERTLRNSRWKKRTAISGVVLLLLIVAYLLYSWLFSSVSVVRETDESIARTSFRRYQ